MDKRPPHRPAETLEALDDVADSPRRRWVRRLPDGVDFASRRAARGKMQLWLTTFTLATAVAVLIVVSMSVLHTS